MSSPVCAIDLLRIRYDLPSKKTTDAVAVEEPLEIRVAGRSVAVTMRTPGHDHELAAGFLVTEGIVRSRDDVFDIHRCGDGRRKPEENILNVRLARGVKVDFRRLTRHVFASSSCGICGKATIDSVRGRFPRIRSRWKVSRRALYDLPGRLREAQVTFEKTGGLHASALFDAAGGLRVVREDGGRHNAVDKVVGWAFFENRLPLRDAILQVSGRVSFEILQKALAAGIPVVAAISAPSSLAVQFARESGQTLVGFLRGKQMNVYAHPERIG